ncbi:hypothetical protein BCR35DRAFT_306746 [Leucosporidium creatinivorum]|uniref:Uncharacterized protein n=1 Tax=Leucosporidium creatinivorum TaxID=106004 RepID=A0A1Y2ERY8_9BASI|nr:hypothetical protein BCR35DRAFT_306746 [Leucosporidium creatinivorum]
MVWIIHGNLNSGQDDAPDSTPPLSSHYIHPNRSYRSGRMGGWQDPKSNTKTKPRPHDFKIKSLTVSKEGAWELTAGGQDWQPLDDPTSPTNLDPYPLTLKLNHSNVVLHRGESDDEQSVGQPLPQGEHRMQHGDRFVWGKFRSEVRFEWKPYIFSHPTMKGKDKDKAREDLLQQAKEIGVKFSFTPPLPHHTHLLTARATPSSSLLLASMSLLPILSPTYFTALHTLCTPPPYPSPSPIGDPPAQTQEGDDSRALDKKLGAWEKQLLALNPEVGYDWRRWWGHSAVEEDWERRPDEEDEKWRPKQPSEGQFGEYREVEKWAREEGRKKLFEGVVVVSYRGLKDSDDLDARLLTLGSGHFLASHLLTTPEVNLTALLLEIDDFKKSEKIQDKQVRVVLLAPPGVEEEVQQGEGEDVKVLRQLAKSLTNSKLHPASAPSLVQSIYHVDSSPLFALAPPPPSGDLEDDSPNPARHTRSHDHDHDHQQAPTPSNNSMPFPSGGVPGTWGDESLGASAKGKGKEREGEGVSVSGEKRKERDEMAGEQVQTQGKKTSPPRKKLARHSRAASRAAQGSLFDDDDDDDQPPRAASSLTSGGGRSLRTQETGAGRSLDGVMEVDEEGGGAEIPVAVPSRAPPPARTGGGGLKRRAASQPSSTLFDSDDSDGATDRRATKKTREERMREKEEEDERIAKEEVRKAKERREKGLPVVVEEEEGEGVKKGKKEVKVKEPVKVQPTRKRQASEAVSGSEASEEEGAHKAKSKGKGKEVAVPAARKRLRSASVQPQEDSDEDRPAASAATTKKKATTPAPSASTSTAKPGTKKAEAAAKKLAKAQQAELEANLLIVKPKRSTKAATAAVDQAFADEFNALKIVRPKLVAMKKVEKHRMGWDELDPDEEMNRLIREEEEWREDPGKWEGKATQMFVVRDLELERKERGRENRSLDLPEQWRGRPNFKRFKPKNLQDPRHPQPQHPRREPVELVIPKLAPVDFGIGEGYRDKRKLAYRPADDDEDDSELSAGNSPKLNFKKLGAAKKKSAAAAAPAKPKAKGKGKAKTVASDSEDDDASSARGGGGEDDDVEMLDLDSAEEEEAQPKAKAKGKAPAKPKAPAKKPASKKAAAPKKKAAIETMLVLDSDEDEDDDDGLTFKGFGAKRKR